MRAWVYNEDGPECVCGNPTVVKKVSDDRPPVLLCLFHTQESGCFIPLPILAPENWEELSYQEVLMLANQT